MSTCVLLQLAAISEKVRQRKGRKEQSMAAEPQARPRAWQRSPPLEALGNLQPHQAVQRHPSGLPYCQLSPEAPQEFAIASPPASVCRP